MTRVEQKVEDLKTIIVEMQASMKLVDTSSLEKKVNKISKLEGDINTVKKQLNSLGPILQRMQKQIDVLQPVSGVV